MTEDEKMEKFHRLPKWAQNEIFRLERNVSSLKTDLKQYEGEEETNIFILDMLEEKPLQKDCTVRFKIDENTHFDVNIKDKNSIYVSSHNVVQILPRASNCFIVKSER